MGAVRHHDEAAWPLRRQQLALVGREGVASLQPERALQHGGAGLVEDGIERALVRAAVQGAFQVVDLRGRIAGPRGSRIAPQVAGQVLDRKSTRLNSSHLVISYAVFCL